MKRLARVLKDVERCLMEDVCVMLYDREGAFLFTTTQRMRNVFVSVAVARSINPLNITAFGVSMECVCGMVDMPGCVKNGAGPEGPGLEG